jgi:ubiquinone/menaquinone biosynthesis C-methylase UbiE
LALAHSFQEVWAIDLEPEMIEVGQGEAERQGIKNIKWMTGRAENLEAPASSFELIAIGEAFHRLDQQVVTSQAARLLIPGGCVATLGSYSVLSGKGPWQEIVGETVRRWRSRNPNGDGLTRGPASHPEHNERVFREAGFADVASYAFVEMQEWTIESILGYLYSTSASSRAALGTHIEGFETDLRAALLAHDPSGIYREDAQWGYTLGRKPN